MVFTPFFGYSGPRAVKYTRKDGTTQYIDPYRDLVPRYLPRKSNFLVVIGDSDLDDSPRSCKQILKKHRFTPVFGPSRSTHSAHQQHRRYGQIRENWRHH